MFNITVIRLKDVIKILAIVIVFYIVSSFFIKNDYICNKFNKNIGINVADIMKFSINVIIIYILGNFVFKNIQFKNYFNQSININMDEFVKMGLNKESSIFRYISGEKEAEQEKTEEVEADFKSTFSKKIFNLSSNIFNTKAKDIEVGQDKNESLDKQNLSETEEQKEASTEEVVTDNKETKVVTKNPITEKYNKEYNGIKIKNETSYELTDDMLNPGNLEIDKKDIIIFHTHTCESYTMTENYKYEPSRKLPYNKPKFLSSKSWR